MLLKRPLADISNIISKKQQQQQLESTFNDSSGSMVMVRMARTSVTADIRAISNVDSTTTAAMSVNNSTAAMATMMSDAVADDSFMDLDGSIHPS
jgi:hypothetical protein